MRRAPAVDRDGLVDAALDVPAPADGGTKQHAATQHHHHHDHHYECSTRHHGVDVPRRRELTQLPQQHTSHVQASQGSPQQRHIGGHLLARSPCSGGRVGTVDGGDPGDEPLLLVPQRGQLSQLSVDLFKPSMQQRRSRLARASAGVAQVE